MNLVTLDLMGNLFYHTYAFLVSFACYHCCIRTWLLTFSMQVGWCMSAEANILCLLVWLACMHVAGVVLAGVWAV